MAHLRPADRVSVSLPMSYGRQDMVEFHVVALIDAVVALDPVVKGDTRLLPDRVRDCYLTIHNGRGLVSHRGVLYEKTRGDWRFKVTDEFPSSGNRSRIRLCAPISLTAVDGAAGDEPIETETTNVGIDGVLLDATAYWPPPDRVGLTLSLPGEDESIDAVARLSACEGMLCDFVFEGMSSADRNRLGTFIIQDQRAALRRREAWNKAELAGLDDDLDL